jgi:hypothetical protein
VKTDDTLRNTIAMSKPNTTIELAVTHRDGKTTTVKAKLGELKDEAPPMVKGKANSKKPSLKKAAPQQWQWGTP